MDAEKQGDLDTKLAAICRCTEGHRAPCITCQARAELSALRAENARMREALLSFTEAGCPCSDCVRARAALGGRDEGS